MATLALKLFMTPFLIAGVSLAGRRWGPSVTGWLIGFPLTSGPISIILTLQQGPAFAAQSAVGTLGGVASVCVFCMCYTLLSKKISWQGSLAGSILSFFLTTALLNYLSLPLLPTLALSLLLDVLALYLIPRSPQTVQAAALPRWDLPARMGIATLFVLGITAVAGLLGPLLSGLLMPFPIFTSVLAAFTHRQQGPQAVMRFLRGLVISLLGFSSFFLVVGGLLSRWGAPQTYLLAVAAVVCVNVLLFNVLKTGEKRKT